MTPKEQFDLDNPGDPEVNRLIEAIGHVFMTREEQQKICAGCAHNISVLGYFRRCNKPSQLEKYSAFYHVNFHPSGPECHVPKPTRKETS